MTPVRVNFRKDAGRTSPKEWKRACNDSPAERFPRSEARVSMSISALGNSLNSQQASTPSFQLANSQFRQLGQDLTSGNLSAAQSDFATLQQAFTTPATSSSSSANPVAQAFQQLSSDLSSGNLSAAKQDYSNIQQQFSNRTVSGSTPHHSRVQHGTKPNNAGIESNRTAVVVNGFFLRQYKRRPASVWWGFANAREHGRDKPFRPRRGFDRPFRSADFTARVRRCQQNMKKARA